MVIIVEKDMKKLINSGMSELKQRLYLKELAKIGFKEAYYIPDSDKIKTQPNDDRMPFIDNEGTIWHGSEFEKFVNKEIKPIVDKVSEINEAWDKSSIIPYSDMPYENLTHFRILFEHKNFVLAGRDDTESGGSIHYATGQYNQEHTHVKLSQYTEEYTNAKSNFANLAGIELKEVATYMLNQAAASENGLDSSERASDGLKETPEDMENSDSFKPNDFNPSVEKSTPDKGPPAAENPVVAEQLKELYKCFIDKVDAEMESYTDYVLQKDKREIFGLATDIAMREEVVWSIKNNEYDFDVDDLEYLLSYDDFLTETAGVLKKHILDGIATTGDVEDFIRDIITDNFVKGDYSIYTDLFDGKQDYSGINNATFFAQEIPKTTDRQLELQKWLSDMISDNMTEAVKQCMSMDKSDIINMASKLTSMEDVKAFFDNNDVLLRKDDYEYLCQYHSPLEIIADRWYEKSRDTNSINETVKDILDNRDIGSEYKKALFASPHKIRSILENTKKSSILADLAEKMEEVKPPSAQKKNNIEIE